MDWPLLLAFWGLIALLIAVPGPDWAFAVAAGARDRSVLPAVTGLVLGYLVLTTVVAVGLGVLVPENGLVLTVITALGSAYLAYLGLGLLLRPATPPTASAASPSGAGRRLLHGLGVSALNPKGLLIFVALLPQFTHAGAPWPVPVQLAVLGAVFAVTGGVFFTVLGLSARAVLAARPSAARVISRVAGASMVTVAVVLVVERIVALAGG